MHCRIITSSDFSVLVDVSPRPRQDPPKEFSHLGGERLEVSALAEAEDLRLRC